MKTLLTEDWLQIPEDGRYTNIGVTHYFFSYLHR